MLQTVTIIAFVTAIVVIILAVEIASLRARIIVLERFKLEHETGIKGTASTRDPRFPRTLDE